MTPLDPAVPRRPGRGLAHAFAACALLTLAACAGGPDGRYFGKMATQTGICGLSATPDGQIDASLTIRGGDVRFVPEQGVVVLPGRIDAAGHVIASDSQPGADRKSFVMVFEGDLHGDTITGRYATPRCRATVTLARN